MNKQLVVSHYEQDLTWVHEASTYIDMVVYDKSEKDSNYSKLRNIGREPHTYMHHIVENYDSLAEWTIFAQDNPFDHVEDWSSILSGNTVVWDALSNFTYKGGYFFSNMGLVHCDQAGLPHHPGLPIVEVWDRIFNVECPTLLEFVPGCHFILHRDLIRTKPRTFYENTKSVLESMEGAPWVLERLITYIFR